MQKTLLTFGSMLALTSFAVGQGSNASKLFLVGAEPQNAEMTFVEMTWLPKVTDLAPGLTGVLPLDPRISASLEACGEELEFDLLVARSDNTFGGFALQVGFDPTQNADFQPYMTCALERVQSLQPDEQEFLKIQQEFYSRPDFSFLSYVLSLMTEFGYGLAREEFASPVPRPSELFSLTLEDYRGAWPNLFDSSDLYATVVSPTGVADLLVVIDELTDKSYGNPDQAVLPQQPPYSTAPLEGLGLKLPGSERAFYQVNRVFAPSIEGSLVEGGVFGFIMDQRLDAYRTEQGLLPTEDIFQPIEEEEGEEIEEEDISPEFAPGLLGIQPSSFIDGNYIAGFTFLGIFQGPQPMAPSVDGMVAAIETAMSTPFTQAEFDEALADLQTNDCSVEPVDGMAQTQGVWLREDLFHGRADSFIASDVLGCESLTLEGVNAIRDQALRNSSTLIYGIGAIVEDGETLARPICLVEDIGQLEFECSKSEFQL